MASAMLISSCLSGKWSSTTNALPCGMDGPQRALACFVTWLEPSGAMREALRGSLLGTQVGTSRLLTAFSGLSHSSSDSACGTVALLSVAEGMVPRAVSPSGLGMSLSGEVAAMGSLLGTQAGNRRLFCAFSLLSHCSVLTCIHSTVWDASAGL